MKKQILCEAIRTRRLVSFLYDGMVRVVEPYLVGELSTGNIALSAWHVSGFSKSRNIPDWRLYTLDKIGVVSVLEESFDGPRPGYNRNDSRMERVFCAY